MSEFRIQRLEERVKELEAVAKTIPVILSELVWIKEDIKELHEENRGTRRALWGIAASIVTGSALTAVSLLTLFGGPS